MLRSDPRIHYKMYKAKKNMVYATLFSFAVLGGLGFSQNAKADTVENNNVTPTVQTTTATPQSTAAPQSSAADVNAVNSAPTTQPIVSNQDDSASNVDNQIQTTTLNVQSDQPAQNFAATNQARLFVQRLAQTSQSQAQNVNLSAVSRKGFSTTYARAIDDDDQWNLSGSFTITADQMHAGQSVTVATIQQRATDGSASATWPRFSIPANLHIYKNKIDCGQLATNDDFSQLRFIPNKNAAATGNQTLLFNIPGGLCLSWQTPATVIKQLPSTIQYKIANLSFTVTYTAPDEENIKQNYEYGAVTSNNADLTVSYGAISTKTSEDWQRLEQSGGTAEVPVRDNFNFGVHIQSDHAMYAITNSYGLMPTVNVDPVTHQIYRDGYIQAYRSSDLHLAADGLSLQQLKALNQSGTVYSRQADGSFNVWVNTPASTVKQSDTEILEYAGRRSFYPLVHHLTDQQAADAVKNYMQSSGLDGLPIYQFRQMLTVAMADPSVKSTVTADLYNNDLQKFHTVSNHNYPASSMASGQAAVKLHVINATNGTELNQWRKLISEARNKKNSSQ